MNVNLKMFDTQENFKCYNHLGAFNPYYFIDDKGKFVFDTSFEGIFAKYQKEKKVDAASIACVLNKNFMLGDCTIIKGINRSPWMARPNADNSSWEYAQVPLHGHETTDETEIAATVFELLCKEVKNYVGNSKSVGILLSGGMDSRIVAGVLNNLIKAKSIEVDKVVAYTWGNEDSRDVVYAKEIALRLGWQWKHYVVDSERLWRNIELAGKRGCEYSGIHLHAMPDVAADAENEVEVMLAGSYGDSVGRAEFSGRHITNLLPIDSGIKNSLHLINNSSFKSSINDWKDEVEKYHNLFPRKKEYQQRELDYQLHYMRRMLNPCMEVINEKVPLFQAFTSPEVFGFMYSIEASLRKNNVYYKIFEGPLNYLHDIPWARTGLPYGVTTGQPDSYKRKHHSYQHQLQFDLYSKMMVSINESNYITISKNQVKRLAALTHNYKNNNFDFLESLSWCVSFGQFLKNYKLTSNVSNPGLVTDILEGLSLTSIYHIKRNSRKYLKS